MPRTGTRDIQRRPGSAPVDIIDSSRLFNNVKIFLTNHVCGFRRDNLFPLLFIDNCGQDWSR